MTNLSRRIRFVVRASMRRWLKWALSMSAVAALGSLFITPFFADEQKDDWRAMVSPDNSLAFMFLRGNDRVFSISLGGWGPNWGWVGIGSNEKATGDEFVVTAPFEVNKAQGQVIVVQAARVAKRRQRDIHPIRAFRRQGRSSDHADRRHKI